MRVMLTGIGGFVGSHTFAHLMHNTDWHVVGIDSFRHKGKADRIAQMVDAHPEWRERLTLVTHDLTAPFTPQTIARIGHVDYVIAMASESHVDRSIDDPVPFVKNNVDVILNTLEFCRTMTPQKVIVVSTDEVYGPTVGDDRNNGHAEGAPILPSNPYAASKACQEAIATSYWRTYGVPVIITNTMNIIGEMQDPEKYLPMLISRIKDGDEVTIHGTEDNIGSRYYLHARNAADAWVYILRYCRADMHFDGAPQPARFNVVGEQRVNNLELAQMVAQHMDKDLYYKLVDFHSARPGHDAHYGLDGARLWFHGWAAPLSFETSLKKTIDWTLDHPEWLV